ncbi:MAG: type II secretion system F family protein [Candidatus Wildermuthbacteria bacterium]|nr:type II secretion system F family protein [Candidatus Wildermuthbacteria bacterium]
MKFNYQARNGRGELKDGVVEAASEDGALDVLSQSGWFITKLSPADDKPIYQKDIQVFNSVSVKDVMIFSRQLSILVVSQVSLIDALFALAKQVDKKQFREIIRHIQEEVEAGTALSKACSKYPKVFSPFYVSMLRSGEASGKLSEVLQFLAEHLERENELTSKVKGAMIYPAFILLVVVAVILLMTFFVIPNVSSLLEGTTGEKQLPFITRAILGFTDFVIAWWWLLLGGLVVAGIFFMQFRVTPQGKRAISRIILAVPILSRILKLTYLARFAENVSTLIVGGISIVQALEITGQVVDNVIYQDILKETTDAVRNGEPMSSVLRRYPEEFPPVFTQMVYVGEQSGSLDTTLAGVVGFYRREVNRLVDNMLGLMEPFLIVVLGVVVGGIMVAIMLPIYQGITSI